MELGRLGHVCVCRMAESESVAVAVGLSQRRDCSRALLGNSFDDGCFGESIDLLGVGLAPVWQV